ncbi:amino acid ABC transporter substrate-binding protein [Plastoroseomonas hellenica]|uniref:amino acid ABC transporter substrate-binding protein n=1 Tax=Plastoroseomonas hellenica TaxID=2687306 RepID=UPI001BAB1585|nr:amino acid ABC transporter substrate-binding protein [Plastoroseomonas hellenica]MBR0644598.1 amino acid ABC transporter substrate-binding protein [Plastoroseomonas hellenica]
MRARLLAGLAAGLLALAATPALAGQTLDAVRQNGVVRCGVPTAVAGMARPDSRGRWVGLHADICRAVAAAALGDAEKVRFVPVTAQSRFTALQSGEVDLLVYVTALTLARDATMGLSQVAPYFYTGQGFLVRRSLNVSHASELDGATVCSTQGSIVERNLADFAQRARIRLTTIAYDTQANVVAAFIAGRCDAISNDMISLSANRLSAPDPDAFILLPELISKEPQGALVRNGDAEWAVLVRWSIFALIQAEEFGLTRENVVATRASTADPEIRRFLGLSENVGAGLGLRDDWAFQIVRQVGDYGTLYETHAGARGLGLERGLNRLWNQGGLMMSWLWQ